jgi:peptidoglycan/LPS O-acetylase OafA/YrhL
MLVVACVLGRLLLAAGGQPEQASAAAAATLWLSNFHFAFLHMGYFAPGPETNLFLHTWSLGVEEQFYLIWPLLVVLAMSAWEGAKRPSDTRRLKWLFGVIFIASLALSLYWTQHSPHMAFYMMPSRAWQFALGALVFLLVGSPQWHTNLRIPASWLAAAGWVGLASIVLAALAINGKMPYPGVVSLLPTLGAALVLAAGGRGDNTGPGRILALPPMQAVGRVSYSWYLWHWPVLLLGATVLDIQSGWVRLALVVASLVIAAMSYHWVETPIRHYRKLLARPRMAVFVALAIMVLAGSAALRWGNAALARLGTPEQRHYEAAHFEAPRIYAMGCDDWYHSNTVNICGFGAKDAPHTAVVMGDSVGLQWFPAYAYAFEKPGWRLLVITKSSCPMVDAPFFYERIGRSYTECAAWRQAAVKDVASLSPDVLILGSAFTYPFTRQQWIEGTQRVLHPLAAHAGQVYIMRSTPILRFDGPDCAAPRSRLFHMLSGAARCTSPAYTQHDDTVLGWMRTAISKTPNAHLIDMTEDVCPGGVCHAELDGRIVYRDNQHLTASFARSLGPALAAAMSGLTATQAQHPAAGTAITAPKRLPSKTR